MKIIVATTIMMMIAVFAQNAPQGTANAQDTGEEAAKTTVFDPTAETPDVDSAVPTDLDELFAYLQEGSYRDFPAQESAPHPSRGPHTNVGWPVRVFMDPIVSESLEAGNASHPVGSSIVKEMFNGDGDLQGWAVMVKTNEDSAGGKGWFWYEVTSTESGLEPVAAGNGVQLCQGCHFIGKDFVLTYLPLQ